LIAEGDTDGATEQIDLAEKAEQAAQQVWQTEVQQHQSESRKKFESDWKSGMEQAIRNNPELANPDNPISQRTSKLLGQEPVFSILSNGFSAASNYAATELKAESASEWQARAEKAEAEVARLNGLTSVSRSSPSSRPSAKSFEEMNPEEMRDHLKRRTEEADSLLT